ncbi:MAG TPA: fructose-bisphosphatase class II family protein [Solirubrobacterales bacterium]|nr:fructose-bisphosphatase class II family protein [Solirubrobacterales bacterium]
MLSPATSPTAAEPRFDVDSPLVACALAATRAAAVVAARFAGRGDGKGADGAATAAMRSVLGHAPASGTVVTGEGAKDEAPMLADGELTGAGEAPRFEIAVDPLECTDLCAQGLAGALSTIAIAPLGSFWSPGPAFYMEKLVLPPAARDAATLDDPPETIVRKVAAALGRPVAELRVVVLDKPRHAELAARLRALGAAVVMPPAGDVAGSLAVLLDGGDADLLLGIGGTPEGVMTACAARALGGGMQARVAPQRDDERERVEAAGLSTTEILDLEQLAAADGAFVATGVTGGELLARPSRRGGSLTTESLVITARSVRQIRQTSPIGSGPTGE